MNLKVKPNHVNILGVHVTPTNIPRVIDDIDLAVSEGRKGYVCVTGVHGIMESQQNPELRDTLNRAFLNVPDGMPTVWLGHLQGFENMARVYGPELMLELCDYSRSKGLRHFLYGGNSGVAERLKQNLEKMYPGLKIVGTYTPPFRPLNDSEKADLQAQVADCQPDIFWVGLSTPKQEKFMREYLPELDTKVMLGVGAAFDVHTGGIIDAPRWMKNAGLQWFHRLLQEPKRLWRRYLINNPIFIGKILLQLLGIRKYS